MANRGTAMSMARIMSLALIAAAVGAPVTGVAQAVPSKGTGANAPPVGSVAPDFSLPGSTRYGRLQDPVKLSDYRGETVVLAFFYQARTKG